MYGGTKKLYYQQKCGACVPNFKIMIPIILNDLKEQKREAPIGLMVALFRGPFRTQSNI